MATRKKQAPKDKMEAKARKIARVLVDALYRGEVEAARIWGLSKPTVYNYWDQLNESPEICHFFTIEKERVEKAWASKINQPIINALNYFDRVFAEASATDPESIKAVTEAFGVLVEAKTVSEMLNGSASSTDRTQTATVTKDAAGNQYPIGSKAQQSAATA